MEGDAHRNLSHTTPNENYYVATDFNAFCSCGLFIPLTDVYLKLGSRKVYISNHFCTGMFHLQTGVQLQEMETSIFREEVLHSACAYIAHHLGQSHSILARKERRQMLWFNQSN